MPFCPQFTSEMRVKVILGLISYQFVWRLFSVINVLLRVRTSVNFLMALNDKVQYWLLSRNCTLVTALYIIWTHERKAVVLVYLKSSLPNLTSIKWRRWKCCLFHWLWWHYIRFVWESQHRNGRDELFIRYVYVRNIKIHNSQWKVCHLNFLTFWA